MTELVHGIEVADPFRWLEDGDSAETLAWSRAQNARTRAALDALPARPGLHARLTELLGAGASAAPSLAGDLVLSLDRWGTHDQAVLVARPADGDPGPVEPRVLVDPAAVTGDATTAIDWFHPSPDGRLVAYGLSTGGDERSTLRILRIADGAHLADEIPDTRAASVAWWPDASGFAYARYPAGDEYHRHIRTHDLGADPAGDPVLVAPFDDPAAWPDVTISPDGRWLLVHVAYGWTRVDVFLVERGTGSRTAVIDGVDAVTAFEVAGDRLVGHTTLDAPRGRVVTAPVTHPGPRHWQTLVPEGDAVIDGTAVAGDHLLVATSSRAVAAVHAHRFDPDRGLEPGEAVSLPELGSLAGLDADPRRARAVLSFTSFTRPPTLFRWTPGRLDRWSALPGAPEPSGFSVEQVHYPSTDGTPIALFLVRGRRGDHESTSPAPTILTGYGGFAVTMSPAYNATAVAHCEQGGVYAVACLRGGAEEGEAWHRAGMREHKQQVFDDFHSAADWLVASGITSRERLAIRGGSNGGLLVGVAMTQRPDLCRAVHCAVPLLDMVRYHHFLIARLWIPEYGDPDDPDEFAWLYSYSPYHHVVDGTCYPALLLTTAEEDSRVDPMHARKFAARVQAATACGDDRPVLVRIESRAGHGQGKPVSKQADEATDVLAFLHRQIGAG